MNFNFSTRLSGISGSATREILKLLSRPEIVSFAGGLPASECLPLTSISAVVQELLNAPDAKRTLQYGTTEGLPELVEALCTFAGEVSITDVKNENCLVVSGGQQGIDLAFRALLDKGDTVLVENPTYLAVLQMIKGYEANVMGVNAATDGLDLDDLKQKVVARKPKVLYVVPTFSNPTGKTYSAKNRVEIAMLCAKHGVVVIEDDPYGKLRYSGKAIPSLKSFDSAGNVVYISSFSKILAPGLRIGFAMGNKDLIRKMAILKQGQDLHTSNLSQAIVSEFLIRGLLTKAIQNSLPIYKTKKDAMVGALKKYMPQDFQFTDPDGGLFIWGEFKDRHKNTVEKFKEAIDQNVAYIQGQVFYPAGDGLNTLRLNFSSETLERIETGVKALAQVFK